MASPLLRLLPYHQRYGGAFWGGAAVLLLARVCEALIPLFLRDSIDAIAAGRQQMAAGQIDLATAQSALLVPTVAIALLVIARFFCFDYARRVIRRIANFIAYDLRKRVYSHLQLQGLAFFAVNPTGDLMARAINDISLVRELLGSGLRTLLVNGFLAIVGLTAMFWLAPTLTLLLLLPLPLIAALGWFAARKVFARSLAVQEGFAALSAQVQGNLQGIRTVQALVQEDNEIRRFDRCSDEYVAHFNALVRTNSFISALMPWLAAFATVIIVGYGGSMVRDGALSLGTFTAFFSYVGMVLWPVREIGSLVTLWQRGASGSRRLHEILDAEPEIADAPDPAAPRSIHGHLQLSDLHYRYPRAVADALHGVTLDIAPGETIAIMGRVGSGKTTLLSMLVRLLDPPPGTLLIDGWDVRAFGLAQLRQQVVLVPQDPFLFAEVLRHNLSYDDPQRDEDLVWQAVDDASLLATVKSFAQALETPVGERGVTLSGGQKQRSTLARGLVRDAPVLVLDDCFSSVDTETEEHILERLFAARRGRTTLLVTNRVSTARHADRIVVLDAGRIVQVGAHAGLLQSPGWYADLDRIQRRRTQAGMALHAAGGG